MEMASLATCQKNESTQPNKENRKVTRREKDRKKQKQEVQFVEKPVSTQGGCKGL